MGDHAQGKADRQDGTELGDVLNDIPTGGMLQEALKDPVRGPIIRKRMRAREERERQAHLAKAKAGIKAKEEAKLDKVEAAHADVVDGVPTGSTVQYDDDNAIEMEVEEKKNKTGFKDGNVTHDRNKKVTTSSGDNKEIRERNHKIAVGKGGAAYDLTKAKETVVGDASTKIERTGGATINKEGVEIRGGQSSMGKVGDNSEGTGYDASVAVKKDGTVSVAGQRKSTREDKHGSQETVVGGGLGTDGSVNLAASKKTVKKHGEDADGNPITSSKATNVGGHLSGDGAGADAGHQTTSKTGTTQSVNAGVEVNWKEGSYSAHAGYSLMSKSGNSVKASVEHGVKVHADEPVQVAKDRFEVTYVVTSTDGVSVGAGTKAGGVGVGVSGGAKESEFQSGVRSFKTLEEAKDFREHAAKRIGSVMPITSIPAVLSMPVGETRGFGVTDQFSAGGSLSLEGASVGGSVHKSNTRELDIRRISQQLVDVTDMAAGEKGHDLSISGGMSNTKGSSTNHFVAVTYRFDIYTAEGQAAFTQYCQTRIPPVKGAKRVRLEYGKGGEEHDKVEIPLAGEAQWNKKTSETTTEDDKGQHKQFKGEQSHDQSPGWVGKHIFGDDELHSSAQVVSSQENGKEDGYKAVVKVNGGSGDYNREQLGQIFAGAKHDGKAKASGEWTLSAEITKKTVHELENNSARFKGAKTQDDKMRILSEIMADNGAQAAGGMVAGGGNATAWDLELKGDKNFPGPAGRERLEATKKLFQKMLAESPVTASSVVSGAQALLDELKERRQAVAAKNRYTDLPDGLREEQLKLIDHHIADFESVRHFALMEAIKNNPGEKIDKIKAREGDAHGYDKLKPEERALAKLRDQVAERDASIVGNYQEMKEASKAVQKASRHTTEGNRRKIEAHYADYKGYFKSAIEMDSRQRALDPKVEELRLAFLDPAHRQEAAAGLVKVLSEKQAFLETGLMYLKQAAEAVKPITTDDGIAGYEKFWGGISGTPGDLSDDD